ncbi:MAG: hypothetical protein KJ053_01780 [Dehalococcoidia bacterium]|nr:hypothetical protein [Dehalococcoidia bacterium]
MDCVICRHIGGEGGGAVNLIGLETDHEGVVAGATRRLGPVGSGRAHVLAHVCSQHVVEIYRGRVPEVAMAWRTVTPA